MIKTYSILIALILLSITTPLNNLVYNVDDQGLKPHDPIRIIGDDDFTPENGVVSGSGTPDDPYIIEGWLIDAKDHNYGIFIEDTRKHFIIRNCEIRNADSSGIFLINVSNGKLINNTIIHAHAFGIRTWFSSNISILYNKVINNNRDGYDIYSSTTIAIAHNYIVENKDNIQISLSKNISIINNTITHAKSDGIYVFNSSTIFIINNNISHGAYSGVRGRYLDNLVVKNNIIAYNSFSTGIVVSNANNTSIVNNTIAYNGGGVGIGYSSRVNITHNKITSNTFNGIFIINISHLVITDNVLINDGITVLNSFGNLIANNTVNGKPLIYYENTSDKVIEDAGEVILINCTNITVADVNISNTDMGIEIVSSNNITITQASLAHINDSSIYIQYSDNISLINSSIKYTRFIGVLVKESNNIHIINNNISNNNLAGVSIYHSNNAVIKNTLFTNNYIGLSIIGNNVSVIHNTMKDNRDGVTLGASSHVLLFDNIFINDGLYVWGINSNITIVNNTVNSKPLIYYENTVNKTIEGDVGQVILYNCANIIVKDVNITNTDIAVEVVYSNNVTVRNSNMLKNNYGAYIESSDNIVLAVNNILDISDYGIYVYDSNNIVITGNTIAKSKGVVLIEVDNAEITRNSMINNKWGIRIAHSDNISIYHNNFINNSEQADYYYSSISWDAGYPVGGNYWSDYNGTDQYSGPYQNETGPDGIGDTPYVIGYAIVDHYPLMKPVEIRTFYNGYIYGLNTTYDPSSKTVNYTWRIKIINGTGTWRVVFHGYNATEEYLLNISETPYETVMNHYEAVDKLINHTWYVELLSPENLVVDRRIGYAEITVEQPEMHETTTTTPQNISQTMTTQQTGSTTSPIESQTTPLTTSPPESPTTSLPSPSSSSPVLSSKPTSISTPTGAGQYEALVVVALVVIVVLALIVLLMRGR